MTRSVRDAGADPWVSLANDTTHGGPDALGVPCHDFSTNANACGPCPLAWEAVQQADARTYPDPAYADLCRQLAQFHGVDPARVLPMGSASEAMARLSAAASRCGLRRTWYPDPHFGDVARLSLAWGLERVVESGQGDLLWCCEPSTPLGQNQRGLAPLVSAQTPAQVVVLDCAYAPLRLSGTPSLCGEARHQVWQLWSPNKALGLTGVRAAYLLAPSCAIEHPGSLSARLLTVLQALAPSWVMGVHGVAMLQAWCQADTQAWLAASRHELMDWKSRQQALCERLGWVWQASDTNYFLAQPGPDGAGLPSWRARQGIKLRDATSFGLPGWLRMGVLPPQSQEALWQAVLEWRAAPAPGALSFAGDPSPSPT